MSVLRRISKPSSFFGSLSARISAPSTDFPRGTSFTSPITAACPSPPLLRRLTMSSPDTNHGHAANGINGAVGGNGVRSNKINHWAAPGMTAFDFRSDTITKPDARMLEAIAATTLADDVFQEDPTTNELEQLIMALTGKEASLFVLSGTMGNQIAIRTHLQGPPHSVLSDHRAHIIEWEAGGVASLCGAMCKGVIPNNRKYLTLEDVQKAVDLRDDIHGCPTKLISLENTLGGVIYPIEEVRRISDWAHEHGIIMHLDGARLWEAVAAGAGSLRDYCSLFDSVSLCFSKGLGAPVGSIIVGTKPFRERARWIRKSIGGGIRQAGVLTAAARVAVEDTFLGGKLQACHERARQIAALWKSYGGKTSHPVETNMVWLDVEAAGLTIDKFIELGQKAGLRLLGGRLVVHHQIGEAAIERLDNLFQAIFRGEELHGVVEFSPDAMKTAVRFEGYYQPGR